MIDNTAEGNCQNCGADLTGNYCSVCGQKRHSLNDRSVRFLLSHFFEELFTWDSRFFQSMKYLFTRPGYLTHEYISGRFQKYISPVKMFLFTSFVLFFIMIKSDPDQYKGIVNDNDEDDLLSNFVLEQKESSGLTDEMYINNFNDTLNDNVTLYIFAIMLIFSVLLKAVFITKNIFYAEHIVFTLHFFTFILWCFLFSVITSEVSEFFLLFFLYVLPGIYLFIALKAVYHKRVWTALITSGFLTFSYWCLITMWIIGTVLISAIRA
jgi:hypothetical protein